MKRWNVIGGVVSALFIASILTLVVSIGIPSAAGAAPPCKGPNKNDPSCPSDNDPGAEVPVVAMFNCPDAMTGRVCPSGSTLSNQHRVQGDEPGLDYTDGMDDVTAHIRESGILQLRTDAKGEKPGARDIYWDFREGQVDNGLMLNSGLLLTTTDLLPAGFGHASVIQVGRGVDGVNFNGLTVNQSVQTTLWANLMIKPKKGSKDFVFIRFEGPDVVDQCPDASEPTTITVTRLENTVPGGKRQWEIVGDAAAKACIQGTGLDFVLGPFRFVAQEK